MECDACRVLYKYMQSSPNKQTFKKKKKKKTHLSEARDVSVSSPLFKPTAAVAGASAVSKGGGIWTCRGYDMAVSFIFEVVKVIVKTNI